MGEKLYPTVSRLSLDGVGVLRKVNELPAVKQKAPRMQGFHLKIKLNDLISGLLVLLLLNQVSNQKTNSSKNKDHGKEW